MQIQDFCNEYNIHRNTLYEMKSKKTLPDNIFKNHNIDESFFIRRVNFKQKVWLRNHEMYFFLSKAMTDSDIARVLELVTGMSKSSWTGWLTSGLFSLPYDSIINYKVSKNQWLFFRVASWLIQASFRKLKIPKDKRIIV